LTVFGITRHLTSPRPRRKGRWYPVEHDGRALSLVSVTTVIDGALAQSQLTDWRVNTACDDVIAQARGLYETLIPNTPLSPSSFELTLRRRIGDQWADKRIAEREANKGTRVHDLIQWHLEGELGVQKKPMPEHIPDSTQYAYDAWREWRSGVKIDILGIEQMVYSVTHQYAGRFDLYAVIDDKPTVCDWKTSKSIWPSHKIQLGAYALAAKERGMDVTWGRCVRLPKIPGETFNPDEHDCQIMPHALDALGEMFLWLRRLYEFLQNGDAPAGHE